MILKWQRYLAQFDLSFSRHTAEDMWIDAGRTCDRLEVNREVDWDKGLVSVKASYGHSCE